MSIRTSRSSKRLIAAAVAVAVTASTFAISSTAGATGTTTDPAADRFGGDNRFATAALVSAAVSTSASPVTEVILVNGRNFPDGLAASAIATNSALTAQRPILLTEGDSLPTETADALKAIAGLKTVHVIGGTSVVSSAVLGEIVDAVPGVDVNRISGADRYATAVAVATVASNSATTTPDHIILATGENFPDALAAGALAAENGWPLVLNNGASLRPEVSQFISNVSNAAVGQNLTVLVVGGTAAVPASIDAAINALDNVSAQRLAGANRFETAVAVAASVSAATGVVLANGRNFPDALAAAPLAAANGAPILLTEAGSIPAATAEWHLENANTLKDVWAVGGTSVISAAVLDGAKAAATATAPVFTSASVATTATKSASVALIANQVTVSAVAGGAAAGALGNDWTVTVSTTAVAGLSPVITVSTSANPYSGTDAVATTSNAIVIGVPAGGVSAANLKAAWDASDAAALIDFTVGAGSGTTVIALGAGIGDKLAGGATEVKLTLSFSEAAASKSATPFQVFTNSLLTDEITGLAIPTPTASTDGKSLTFVVLEASEDATDVAALTTGTAVVRILTGGFQRKGLASVEVAAGTQTLS